MRVALVLSFAALCSSLPAAHDLVHKYTDKLRDAYASSIHEFADALVGHKAACSGAGEPKWKAPYCFKGKKSILGMDEEIDVRINSYSKASGTLDLMLTGSAYGTTCQNVTFTKSHQDLSLDTSACNLKGAVVKAKYCAEQNTVNLAVGFEDLHVSATLAPSKCSS